MYSTPDVSEAECCILAVDMFVAICERAGIDYQHLSLMYALPVQYVSIACMEHGTRICLAVLGLPLTPMNSCANSDVLCMCYVRVCVRACVRACMRVCAYVRALCPAVVLPAAHE